jgi:hypothetical protein
MTTIFKAIDGEIFETLEECLAYEEKLAAKDFDNDLKEVFYACPCAPDNFIDCMPINSISRCYVGDVCYIPNETALRALRTSKNFRYADVEVGYNYYTYEEDHYCWRQDVIEDLIEQKDEINRKIETYESRVAVIEEKLRKKLKEDK